MGNIDKTNCVSKVEQTLSETGNNVQKDAAPVEVQMLSDTNTDIAGLDYVEKQDDNIRTEVKTYPSGGTAKIQYDSNGREKVFEEFSADGTLRFRRVRNEDGSCYGDVYYESGSLKSHFENDALSLNYSSTDYYENGNVKGYCRYENDIKVAQEGYHEDGTPELIYKMDSAGNLVEGKTFYPDGTVYMTYDHGNVTFNEKNNSDKQNKTFLQRLFGR